VCTGSALAAQAGVLDGKKATTNKFTWEYVTGLNDRVGWVRKARWVVDGNVYTSSGISAGIDATLAFVENTYSRAVAEQVARRMEYTRIENSEDDPFCKKNI
jgi:transcriptional regulator GlxA family with amidase domain